MKALGFDNVLEDFISEHDDDPDAIRNAQKRIGYGTYWCAQNDWKFLYGRIDDDVRTFYFIDTYSRQLQGTMEDVYMGPLIIKTFVAHYNFMTPSKTIPNYNAGVPIGGIALAVSAVSNTNQIHLHVLNVL